MMPTRGRAQILPPHSDAPGGTPGDNDRNGRTEISGSTQMSKPGSIRVSAEGLSHPGRNLSQSAVWQDDGAELFSLICYALTQRHHRSVVRMKSVVDGDFFVLLFVGMM